MAFIVDRLRLIVVNLQSKKVRQITDGSTWYSLGSPFSYSWSPDGRWFALRQLLATTPGAYIDASNPRQLASLARQLGFASARACRSWLEALVECGAVSREDWEQEGWVVDVDVANQQVSYQARARVNRSNRSGSGKARDTSDESETNGRRIVNESCGEGATNA